MEAHGYNGQVTFDGQAVTISRHGPVARLTIGKGEKRIPLRHITAVQYKPAGIVNGFIQFTVAGGVERRSRFGRQSMDAAKDENSVTFLYWQRHEFAELHRALNDALAAHASRY